MERLKYQDIVNYCLNYLEVQDGAYKSSFVKYSMKKSKERQMKDARQMIMKETD
jgi:hypothetical protein